MQVHSAPVPVGSRDMFACKNFEPPLIYCTTRGKVELEHNIHTVYTVHQHYNMLELEAKSSSHTVDTKCTVSAKIASQALT